VSGTPRISLVVIALDEERDLPGCLDSVPFAFEKIVVDSGSADRTAQVAEEHGASVHRHPFESFSRQKQHACDLASGDWLLLLDADERLCPRFGEEATRGISSGRADSYRIRRRTRYLGRTLRHGPWRDDAPVRLFRRGTASFGSESVHESLRTGGRPPVLPRAWIEHEPYADVAEHMRKMALYVEMWAADRHAAGRRATLAGLLLRPQWRLFRGLVLQMGLLDGLPGIAASAGSMVYAFWKYLALWEKNHGKGG
jgi:hypothetical protein